MKLVKFGLIALATITVSACSPYEYIQGNYMMVIYNRSVEICNGVPTNIQVDSGQYAEYVRYDVLVGCADYNAEFSFKGGK